MEIKILVVDDNEAIRSVIVDFFENQPYKIDQAHRVQEAIELISSKEYDIVITDKNMPGIHGDEEGGMEIIKYLRNHHPNIEVIMMTGYPTLSTAIETMRLGAFDYLPKPFSPALLQEKIDRIIQYKSFINPERTIEIYKAFHNGILKLLHDQSYHDDQEIQHMISSMDNQIDHFFRKQKEWEMIILEQRMALSRIAALTEQLQEKISNGESGNELITAIYEESNQRI
jgi:DNA-binding response OmpR family regulator